MDCLDSFFHVSERLPLRRFGLSTDGVTRGQRQVVCGAVKVAWGNNSLLNDTVHLLFICI